MGLFLKSCLIGATIFVSYPLCAQDILFVIRHAEKAPSGPDPDLTERGRAQARAWARMLTDADLDVVMTSDARRSQETGRIVATALDLPVEQREKTDTAGLLDALAFDHSEERVLVVSHRETIPAILSGLGYDGPLDIATDDFTNLFILNQPDSDTPRFIHMRLSAP